MKRPDAQLARALYLLTKDRSEDQARQAVAAFARFVSRRFGPGALGGVLKRLPAEAKKVDGIEDVTVETARPLPEEALAAALRSVGIEPSRAEVSLTVRPELVGGIRIRRADTLIDATVRRQLDKLSQVGK